MDSKSTEQSFLYRGDWQSAYIERFLYQFNNYLLLNVHRKFIGKFITLVNNI